LDETRESQSERKKGEGKCESEKERKARAFDTRVSFIVDDVALKLGRNTDFFLLRNHSKYVQSQSSSRCSVLA
jgi:hypothetical protein